MNIKFSDEQSPRLQIVKCWSITFQLPGWRMQGFFVWNPALLRNQCQTRMSLVSSKCYNLKTYQSAVLDLMESASKLNHHQRFLMRPS